MLWNARRDRRVGLRECVLLVLLLLLCLHLLLISHFLLVPLLHNVLVVEDGVRELLLEDILIQELLDAPSHDGLLQYLCYREPFAHIDLQKLENQRFQFS